MHWFSNANSHANNDNEGFKIFLMEVNRVHLIHVLLFRLRFDRIDNTVLEIVLL